LHTKNLSEKVSLAWDYFSPRYKQIEQLGCSSQDKEVLYTWYSLQVKDALNDQETVACTHYCESGKKWLERLNQAGFTSIELEAVAEPSFIDQDGRKAQGKNQAAFFTLIQCKNY
jgi:hypothetical protein